MKKMHKLDRGRYVICYLGMAAVQTGDLAILQFWKARFGSHSSSS